MENTCCLTPEERLHTHGQPTLPGSVYLRRFPHTVSAEREDYNVDPDSSAKNVSILVVTICRQEDIPANISEYIEYIYI